MSAWQNHKRRQHGRRGIIYLLMPPLSPSILEWQLTRCYLLCNAASDHRDATYPNHELIRSVMVGPVGNQSRSRQLSWILMVNARGPTAAYQDSSSRHVSFRRTPCNNGCLICHENLVEQEHDSARHSDFWSRHVCCAVDGSRESIIHRPTRG